MLDGKAVSEGHIRPYTLCSTPDILLPNEDELFAALLAANSGGNEDENDGELEKSAEGTEAEDFDDEEQGTEDAEDDVMESRVMHRGNTRVECYELLQDLAFALPRRDEQKLAELRSTETGEPAWDETSIILVHAALEGQYDLKISEPEVARCETIGDLVALVRSKVA